MRKTILAFALAALLSGCASVPTSVEVDARVAQVQALTASVCKFVPTAATVASIIGALTGNSPIVTLISDAANSICSAVTRVGVRRGGDGAMSVVVGGKRVKVEGQFR